MELLNNPLPNIINNISVILAIIMTLLNIIFLITNNILGLILKRNQRKKYNQIIDELEKQLEEFWSKEKASTTKLKKITAQFKSLSVFISNARFKKHPGDYRYFLYEFFTMDVEDNDIFQEKKKYIDKHIKVLLMKLKEYNKYITLC